MLYVKKNFDNFEDAKNFRDALDRCGADTKLYATWSRKEKEYIITVNATMG